MSSALPLLITMGEPAGVGPDIILSLWTSFHETGGRPFALIGDAGVMRARAAAIGITVPLSTIETMGDAAAVFGKALPVLDRPVKQVPAAGRIASENASSVTGFITEAVELAMKGACAGIVTGPIQKETLYGAGFTFEGHTDFLADLAKKNGGKAVPVMMLVANDLRTIPVTVHIPLKDVTTALTTESIVSQARVAASDLKRYFGIGEARIAITGLNPHAGEGGTMGREEITIIMPAIRQLQSEGLNVTGPLPGDTAFYPEARNQFDVIVCMYHDQALIPVKTLDFHGGINVTLGLPFIRTSPDHGTALNLAGTGSANPRSFMAALKLADQMAQWAAS